MANDLSSSLAALKLASGVHDFTLDSHETISIKSSEGDEFAVAKKRLSQMSGVFRCETLNGCCPSLTASCRIMFEDAVDSDECIVLSESTTVLNTLFGVAFGLIRLVCKTDPAFNGTLRATHKYDMPEVASLLVLRVL